MRLFSTHNRWPREPTTLQSNTCIVMYTIILGEKYFLKRSLWIAKYVFDR